MPDSRQLRPPLGRADDFEDLAFLRERVVQVGDEVFANSLALGVVPTVLELVGIFVDLVELAFGSVVLDAAHRALTAEHAGLREPLLQAVRLADRRLLVRGAEPTVAVNGAHVHPVAGELRVPFAEHALASGTGCSRQRRALRPCGRGHTGDLTEGRREIELPY